LFQIAISYLVSEFAVFRILSHAAQAHYINLESHVSEEGKGQMLNTSVDFKCPFPGPKTSKPI